MRKIFQRGFIWMVTPWFRLQIQNLEWRLIPQKLGLGPRSIRACFWKVPITFRPEVKYSNQNLSAGPSELTSPVCFVTDKQDKTIEISIELSLEWKQQLSGPSEFRETAPTCEYQTIETCLRRLLGQERLCSMSMNQRQKTLLEWQMSFLQPFSTVFLYLTPSQCQRGYGAHITQRKSFSRVYLKR